MKCLVVEDDPVLCFALRDAIRELGHDVHCENTVARAHVALATQKFGLIILDYKLSDGTTVEISNYAAMTQPNCRIILLTGQQVFLAGENKNIAPGIDWILRKPIPTKDLFALVEYAAHDQHWNPTRTHCVP